MKYNIMNIQRGKDQLKAKDDGEGHLIRYSSIDMPPLENEVAYTYMRSCTREIVDLCSSNEET